MPNDVGRPTVMTPGVIRKLEEAFISGATDLEACFYAGISKTPFYEYQAAHPEFQERKEGLKGHQTLVAKNIIAKKLKENHAETARWFLERKDPSFNPKTEAFITMVPTVIRDDVPDDEGGAQCK